MENILEEVYEAQEIRKNVSSGEDAFFDADYMWAQHEGEESAHSMEALA